MFCKFPNNTVSNDSMKPIFKARALMLVEDGKNYVIWSQINVLTVTFYTSLFGDLVHFSDDCSDINKIS